MKANVKQIIIKSSTNYNINNSYRNIIVFERYENDTLTEAQATNGVCSVSLYEAPNGYRVLARVDDQNIDLVVDGYDIVKIACDVIKHAHWHMHGCADRAIARMFLRWISDPRALFDGTHERADERAIREAAWMRIV